MRTSHVPVLVVGAGAAGSMVTLGLARRGVRMRTVDRLPRPSADSRAFALHARTLELLGHVDERLIARFLERGIRCRGYSLHLADAARHRTVRPAVDFTALESRYPFLLVHRQSETEQYLREYTGAHFGVSPDWGASLIAARAVDDGVVATLETDGVEEEVHCDYLVACDGAASSVRGALALARDVVDRVVTENLDVVLEGFSADDDWVRHCAGPGHEFVIARLPGGFYRLQRSGAGASDAAAAALQLQRSVDWHFDGVRLAEVVAYTRWQRHRVAAPIYRRDRVLFVGDAAHGHSPAGGLDLDRALQDADNLAWKLAMLVKGLARLELLDTYEAERRPVDALLGAAAAELQAAFAERSEHGARAASLAARCAGLAFDYRGAAAAQGDVVPRAGPAVGERAPDVALERGRALAGLLRGPWFTLLAVVAAEQGTRPLEALLAPLGKRFAALLAVRVVAPAPVLAERYGVDGAARLWLLRPDGYVAFECAAAELTTLEGWLAERFTG